LEVGTSISSTSLPNEVGTFAELYDTSLEEVSVHSTATDEVDTSAELCSISLEEASDEVARAYVSVAVCSALRESEDAALRAVSIAAEGQAQRRMWNRFAPFEPMDFPPGFEALAACQGAWQEIPQNGRRFADVWIQSFVITGRAWFGGDGSDGYLERRDDGVVIMDGGELTVEEDGTGSVLVRRGKSGRVLRFERIRLPDPDSLDALRGDWFCVEGNVHPPVWLQQVTIEGSVWTGNDPGHGGLLEAQNVSRGVKLLGNVLSLTYSPGQEAQLSMTGPRGARLLYQRVEAIDDPWHYT
jgi:hypothetical protein